MIVGALIIAGAILLSQDKDWMGGLSMGAGAFYALAHTARVWRLGKPQP